MILAPGTMSGLVMLLVIVIVPLFFAYLVKGEMLSPTIRQLPALDAIDEAMGRAVEMGRPVHYTTGYGEITDHRMAMILAGLTILGRVARLCARLGVRLFVTCSTHTVLPLTLNTVREAYMAENAEASYRDEIVTYTAGQTPYQHRMAAVLMDYKCAASFMFGSFHGASIQNIQAGVRAGSMNIGGTCRLVMIPNFVVGCDYALVGEELFAAMAVISKDPEQLGNISGEDIVKVFCVVLILVGSILATGGINLIGNLLGM